MKALVFGGTASGKSEFAETLALAGEERALPLWNNIQV